MFFERRTNLSESVSRQEVRSLHTKIRPILLNTFNTFASILWDKLNNHEDPSN
jgi:hypothetical protein